MPITPAHKIPLAVRRKAVAVHEAGHALVAVALERDVIEAVLRPPYGLSGETRFGGESELLLDLNLEAHRHSIEDAIVVLMAGQIAEAEYWRNLSALYTPAVTSHRSDDAEIGRLKSEFAFSLEHEELFIAHCTQRTRMIVLHEKSQAAIEEIAMALFDHQSVSREQLNTILLRHDVLQSG